MFSTIFLHEIKTWFKKPLFYIYAGVLFLLGMLVMAAAVGVFDSDNVTVTGVQYLNSPIVIFGLISQLSLLAYLLIPSITGATIDRDFKNNMHNVLYSYPLTKFQYLLAKFCAGITVNFTLILAIFLGIILGTYLPGANEELVGPFHLINYAQPFLAIFVPNVIFYSAIVFAIIVFTRDMNIGFMTVLTLIIVQLVTTSMVDNVDDTFWLSLADPLGNIAVNETTKYWTVNEVNTELIPFKGALLWNRLLWLGIASLILGGVIYAFNFSQHAVSFKLFKAKGARSTKKNFNTTNAIDLPATTPTFSFLSHLKTTWSLAKSDTRYIVKGWPFLIIAFLTVVLTLVILSFSQLIYGTGILPKTWTVLESGSSYFVLFTFLLVYLYGGFLMDRARAAHMNQLVDVTPTPNWVFVASKVIALFLMTTVMHTLLIVTGIAYQATQSFYDFQIDLYLFQTYFIDILRYLPWILMAVFVHTLIKNKWLGLTALLVIAIAIPLLTNAIGNVQAIFDFNSGNSPSASDFSGYGTDLPEFYTYRVYWILLGIVFAVLAVLYYRRGQGISAKERLLAAKDNWTKPLATIVTVCLVAFVAIGSYIWYIDNVVNERRTGKEQELLSVKYEKELSKYGKVAQPRLVAVNSFMDIFPDTRDFKAGATYTLVNETSEAIDTLHVNVQDIPTKIKMNVGNKQVYFNEDYQYKMYRLSKPMMPGDTIMFSFTMHNKPNGFLNDNSPIDKNGTFLNGGIFPSIGYSDRGEISDRQLRKKYKLPVKTGMPDQNAPGARDTNYIGGNADWIDFEATVSTSSDQIAIAPGYLIKKWNKGDRTYFHYKMDSKMLNFYSFMSGRYAVKKEKYKGINLEIYHHPDHTYNLDRMMKGLKNGLDYYGTNYTPYQHRQVRIIEFPKQYGSFAQAFPNTIPFSEGVGFVADVDENDKDAVDYALSITAHELAHQWWAHQVIGANAQGATMMSESFSEYSSLKVLEKVYGKSQMRKFLKESMDQYLSSRSSESNGELPLMFNENQQYIHYQKGSVVLYAMSDYLGEDVFNGVMKRFAEKYQFKSAPYPVSSEFVADLKAVTPDSLQYLVKDMFETITLYDNVVKDASYKKLPNGKYEVTIKGLVAKYRSDKRGKELYKDDNGKKITYKDGKETIESLPLADYVEVGIFGPEDAKTGKEKVLYLKKLKVTDINNTFTIIVDEKPA
ncbi:MAG: hypothetical protein NWQ19_06115, partial [Nonlabens sp.]|nr:hypothetical protein [Nonlabens sp.]